MNTQDEKSPKAPITGENIAPKNHGGNCLCCMHPYAILNDELDDEQ